jgi:outer membrane protein TolC
MPVDGKLSLQDALALANTYSDALSLQGEALVRAAVEKRRAVSLFLPTVGLNPQYEVREATGNSSGTADANLDVPVDADLVIFDGMRNVNGYWRDTYLVERERQRLLDVQEQILLDVGLAYYAVLRAEAQVRVLEGSVVTQEERLRDARGRARAGVARPLDVAQTEAQVAETRVRLIEARRAVIDARSLLEFLANAPVAGMQLTDGFDGPVPGTDADALLGLAGGYRSELVASERGIAAAEREVKVALGAYYPSVAVRVSAFLYRESAPSERDWEGLLSVSLPIFSAGRIEADVREAWSFLREAILIDSQSRRRVGREVRQTLVNLKASDDRLAELQVGLAAAREALRQAEASYSAGLGTNLERVTAQEVLLQAELATATQTIEQQAIRLALLRAVGVLRETLIDEPSGMPQQTLIVQPNG